MENDIVIPEEMLVDFQKQLDKHKNKYVNFFMGQVMKKNPLLDTKQVRAMIEEKLN